MFIKTIEPGINDLTFQDGQVFFLYVPHLVLHRPAVGRVVVSVHGYNGRKAGSKGKQKVKRYAEMWSDWADKYGWTVLAPHFDEKRFNNDFQRLNLAALRADEHLNQLVEVVGELLPGLPIDKLLFFGFSAGGQFVHRYAAFNPKRVDRAVVAAPGWYLWPDQTLPYPIGTDPRSLPGSLKLQLAELCRTNLLILAGENDINQGAFRKSYNGYDLSVLQGESRRARAKNWVNAMKELAEQKGYPFNITYEILPKTKHVLSGRLIDSAGQFLLDNV